MTGNSLDAVDCVLTEFDGNQITDLAYHSIPYPAALTREFLALKLLLQNNQGKVANINVTQLHERYIHLVAQTINELLAKNPIKADVIGFHGQTCYHLPPSIARSPQEVKTVQLGSGQMLADLTNLPVVYDFRSDDIFNGGEGAPLAPMHNFHLAQNLGLSSAAFLNAGNTGNIAIINGTAVTGFDVGPCNHLIDQLCRTEKNLPCDFNGQFGRQGKINQDFFERLLNQSAITKKGENFYLKTPPKSSDPAWYKLPPADISFADKIRTLEHLSAWLFVNALKFSPHQPKDFLLFGGGWNNPIILEDFTSLMSAFPQTTIQKLPHAQYLEARIFADMARCKLKNIPFTTPQTTHCQSPTVCGIIAKPGSKPSSIWSRASF